MHYRLLGKSGLRVSELCLGTMTFGEDWGWGASKDESRRIYDTFLEVGGNFIDTANVYTNGTSETLLGEFMAGHRDRIVLATKYSNAAPGNDRPDDGTRPRRPARRHRADDCLIALRREPLGQRPAHRSLGGHAHGVGEHIVQPPETHAFGQGKELFRPAPRSPAIRRISRDRRLPAGEADQPPVGQGRHDHRLGQLRHGRGRHGRPAICRLRPFACNQAKEQDEHPSGRCSVAHQFPDLRNSRGPIAAEFASPSARCRVPGGFIWHCPLGSLHRACPGILLVRGRHC
jgi:hypothetical protein